MGDPSRGKACPRGLVWNVPLEGGGRLVSDEIKIEVDGQLVRSRPDAEGEAHVEERASA